jgi:hypothetical protein
MDGHRDSTEESEVALIEQILRLVWGVAPSSPRGPRVITER